MRRRITIRFAFVALIAVIAFLILRSASVKETSSCQGSSSDCCQKKPQNPTETNLIWETFSRQFIVIGL
jgi:hypothetical protein